MILYLLVSKKMSANTKNVSKSLVSKVCAAFESMLFVMVRHIATINVENCLSKLECENSDTFDETVLSEKAVYVVNVNTKGYNEPCTIIIPQPNLTEDIVESVVDGFVDIVYYMSFYTHVRGACIHKRRSNIDSMIEEFVTSSGGQIGGKYHVLLEDNFIFKMILSEMSEVLITLVGVNKYEKYLTRIVKSVSQVNTCYSKRLLTANHTIQYIAIGFLQSELSLDIMLPLRIVHGANMNKRNKDGKFIRNKEGKIIKPEGWKEPDLSVVLQDITFRT